MPTNLKPGAPSVRVLCGRVGMYDVHRASSRMPTKLKRYQTGGADHFITFSSCRRVVRSQQHKGCPHHEGLIVMLGMSVRWNIKPMLQQPPARTSLRQSFPR